MEATMVAPSETPYPVSVEIPRPVSQSRLTNFPLFIGMFIRYFLLIPHLVVLMFLGLAAGVVGFIADFAILFTGRYPEGMFNFVVGMQRWGVNVGAYISSLRDEYPPFSMDAGEYPAAYNVVYPEKLNRILNFPSLASTSSFSSSSPISSACTSSPSSGSSSCSSPHSPFCSRARIQRACTSSWWV